MAARFIPSGRSFAEILAGVSMGFRRLLNILTATLCLLMTLACATNPATGKRQLSLISESQEIAMGRAAAADVQQTVGLVTDAGLQRYVQRIGKREADGSERPELPWEFHVVDDPGVNAFALPGGFIFLTRGMMSLITSEAELASVLGHEIGHVTARHSVNQLSKQQVAQLGLGLGGLLVPEVQAFGSLLGAGLDLLFLKYTRDHEREADELGFKYMRAHGYDVSEFADVFAALGQLEALSTEQASALPGWLATHPSPEERVQAAEARAAGVESPSGSRVGREEYLDQIDGLVYGKDPRQGFFRDGVFYHPELRFQIAFPSGWQTSNLTHAVVAVEPRRQAVIELTLAGDQRPGAALARFLAQPGLRQGRTSSQTINGRQAAVAEFQAQAEQGIVEGAIGYVADRGRTYQVIGYAPAAVYSQYVTAVTRAIQSFGPVTDRAILSIQPERIDIVRLSRSVTVAEFAREFGPEVSAEHLAVLNGVPDIQARFPAGFSVKTVVSVNRERR
jgi:predicted Zn-dependent protease